MVANPEAPAEEDNYKTLSAIAKDKNLNEVYLEDSGVSKELQEAKIWKVKTTEEVLKVRISMLIVWSRYKA